MSNEKESPWVKRANEFIKDCKNKDVKYYTVVYLLENIGFDNRMTIGNLIFHLIHKYGVSINDRFSFQKNVLGELKREGIIASIPYPGNKGGIFIPSNSKEVEYVALETIVRLISEIEDLKGSVIHHKSISTKLISIQESLINLKADINKY